MDAFVSIGPSAIPPQIQCARDVLVMTTFALAHPSVGAKALEHHVPLVAAVRAMIDAVYTRDAGPGGGQTAWDPAASLEAYVNTIAAQLREHGFRERGRAWTDEHLSLESLGFPESSLLKHGLYATMGVAQARASIEARGKVTYENLDRHMKNIFAESKQT